MFTSETKKQILSSYIVCLLTNSKHKLYTKNLSLLSRIHYCLAHPRRLLLLLLRGLFECLTVSNALCHTSPVSSSSPQFIFRSLSSLIISISSLSLYHPPTASHSSCVQLVWNSILSCVAQWLWLQLLCDARGDVRWLLTGFHSVTSGIAKYFRFAVSGDVWRLFFGLRRLHYLGPRVRGLLCNDTAVPRCHWPSFLTHQFSWTQGL